MRETTDTAKFEMMPEGHYIFTISKVPEKLKSQATQKIYYKFEFETVVQGKIKKHIEVFMPWLASELLKALGATEIEPNKFEWDREAVMGKEIEADLVHELDRKDPNKKWPKLKNITERVPF